MKGMIEISFLSAFDAFAASLRSQCLLRLLEGIFLLAAGDRDVLKPTGLQAGVVRDAAFCFLKCFALLHAGGSVFLLLLCLSLPGIQVFPWPHHLLRELGRLGWSSAEGRRGAG